LRVNWGIGSDYAQKAGYTKTVEIKIHSKKNGALPRSLMKKNLKRRIIL